MTELVEKIKVCLADTFVFKMKVQSYHWNVIGPDFPQYHDFFSDLYEELDGAVDALAEHIRQLDAFAPSSLSRMIELSTLTEVDTIPVAAKMITNLIADNDAVLATVTEAYEMAEDMKEFGLSNYLQDRITEHKKHRWMLKATANQKA
jgi:starvation-inducible DNA-binding protein